eukprot:4144936-Prymnesium_polylepis.1
MQSARNDPGEWAVEEAVRKMLDKIRPVERIHGSSSERRGMPQPMSDENNEDDDEKEGLVTDSVDILESDAP